MSTSYNEPTTKLTYDDYVLFPNGKVYAIPWDLGPCAVFYNPLRSKSFEADFGVENVPRRAG